MKVLYFSATGNSLSVAKGIGGDLISIPQIINDDNKTIEDDVVGVVFPIYCMDFPKMVRKFLGEFTLKAEYTFIIATCGMNCGTTLIDAQEIANKKGYSFDYLNVIKMADNCLPQFEMKKQGERAEGLDIMGNLNIIVDDINNRIVTDKIPAIGGSFMTKITRRFFGVKDDYSKKYIIDEKCNQCGTCTKVCPVGNISVNDEVFFGDYCEGCQACIHLCANNAIHLKWERSEARWLNPDVEVSEIIKSNNVNDS